MIRQVKREMTINIGSGALIHADTLYSGANEWLTIGFI